MGSTPSQLAPRRAHTRSTESQMGSAQRKAEDTNSDYEYDPVEGDLFAAVRECDKESYKTYRTIIDADKEETRSADAYVAEAMPRERYLSYCEVLGAQIDSLVDMKENFKTLWFNLRNEDLPPALCDTRCLQNVRVRHCTNTLQSSAISPKLKTRIVKCCSSTLT